MPLYEVAVIEKPTKKESEDGMLEKIIVKPELIVAKDDKHAGFMVFKKLPDTVDLSKVSVIIRPFG